MNEITQCEVLKSSLRMLNYFYEIISDGYNPTRIGFRYELSRRIHKKELILGPINRFGMKRTPIKTNIEDIIEKLKENIDWSRNHIALFNSCPIIFKDKYRIAEWDEMLEHIINITSELIKNWNIEGYEYEIDSNDGSLRKLMIINDNNKSIIFEFGNFIH